MDNVETKELIPSSIEDGLEIEALDAETIKEIKKHLDSQLKFAEKYLKQDFDKEFVTNDFIFVRQKLVTAINTTEITMNTLNNMVLNVTDPKMLMIFIGSLTEISKVLNDMTSGLMKHHEIHIKNLDAVSKVKPEAEVFVDENAGMTLDDILAREAKKAKEAALTSDGEV